MNKGLEALERAKYEHSRLTNGFPDIEYLKELDIIETALKALEIIKESLQLKMSVDEDIGCLYVPLHNKDICVVGYVEGKDKIDLLKEVLP